MAGLSKSRLIDYLQCPRRLWLQKNRPELAMVDTAQQTRMATGNAVGDVARQLHPGGILIDGSDLSQAVVDTAALLAEGQQPLLFESTFAADGVLVRNDLLLPEPGGYHLAEVKSATQVKDYYLQDVAIQAHVTEAAGVPLNRISVVHIDNHFVYPGGQDYRGLFTRVDVTAPVRALQPQVPGWIRAAQATLAGPEPDVAPGAQCTDPFACPFTGHCHPPVEPGSHPVEELPHSRRLVEDLRREGFDDIRSVPRARLRNAGHLLMWDALQAGHAILRPGAAAALAALPWPRYYLDFETITLAVPIWAGTRPYQQIPFQWSCHVELPTGAVTQGGWLAEGSDDPRRGFVESLVSAIGPRGPVLVYNAGFERSRLVELAAVFPEHATALDSIINRLVDLLPIARANYYHPAMRGSWSIKYVLPTIAPELDYSELEVAHGGMAQEAFARLLDPHLDASERLRLRNALLEYCGRDTLAMVELAHFFEGRRPATAPAPQDLQPAD